MKSWLVWTWLANIPPPSSWSLDEWFGFAKVLGIGVLGWLARRSIMAFDKMESAVQDVQRWMAGIEAWKDGHEKWAEETRQRLEKRIDQDPDRTRYTGNERRRSPR